MSCAAKPDKCQAHALDKFAAFPATRDRSLLRPALRRKSILSLLALSVNTTINCYLRYQKLAMKPIALSQLT